MNEMSLYSNIIFLSDTTGCQTKNCYMAWLIQRVPLTIEPGISLIILTPMKILQRNLNRSTFVVWEMRRNVSVVRFKFRCNIHISGIIIEEITGWVASGTPWITIENARRCAMEMIWGKCEAVRKWRLASTERTKVEHKQMENVECCEYLSRDNKLCTGEIKSGIAGAKEPLNKKIALFKLLKPIG